MVARWTTVFLFLASSLRAVAEAPNDTLKALTQAHPILRGRERCIARVRDGLRPPESTDNRLASAALAACVPGPQWVRVFADEEGATYIDTTRLLVTDRSTVTFWTLVEYFNDMGDFYLGHYVLDCMTGQTAGLQATMVNGGRPGRLRRLAQKWGDVRDGGQGTAVARFVCVRAWEPEDDTA